MAAKQNPKVRPKSHVKPRSKTKAIKALHKSQDVLAQFNAQAQRDGIPKICGGYDYGVS